MEIIDRKTARAAGLKRYFTGKPCVNGHVDYRTVVRGSCFECCRKRWRERYAANREKCLERNKKYRAANRAATIAKGRKRYAANREKERERTQRYRAANREKVLKQRQRYRAANCEKAREYRAANRAANRAKGRERWTRKKYGDIYTEVLALNDESRELAVLSKKLTEIEL